MIIETGGAAAAAAAATATTMATAAATTAATVASGVLRRQLWNLRPDSSTTAGAVHCTPFVLPSNGVLSFGDVAVTLTTNVLFQPACTGVAPTEVFTDDLKAPFYASTIPMTYVIAAATVIAWILVIMLVVTPRTALFSNVGVAPALAGGHGIIGGATSGSAGLTASGSRPWLQKAAALAVAISLTIATADTFNVAWQQYSVGYMDARAMRDEVLISKEIRITRVVSDVFLWLAQVQTLIRLFPRHKEKVLIKWIGFGLIIFDSTFSCLNAFIHQGTPKGRNFVEAIPALSYLFQLALGLLYAAWVIYFALTKYRYAFYHRKMRSICLIAALSLVSILTPVVFFVTDISNTEVAGWGDYVRWVGAAAASVVVWEWVDRIEALERDEKKDGILGREIFDGDEMLDLTPSEEAGRSNSRYRRRPGDRDGGGNPSALEHGFSHVAQRFRSKPQATAPQHFPLGRAHSSSEPTTVDQVAPAVPGAVVSREDTIKRSSNRLSFAPPAQVPTPVSRADTTSAASTVYVVQHDTIADVPQPVRRRVDYPRFGRSNTNNKDNNHNTRTLNEKDLDDVAEEEDEARQPRHHDQAHAPTTGTSLWHAVPNPFKRKRASPPREIQEARAAAAQAARAATPSHNYSRWDLRGRLSVLAAETGDRIRERGDAAARRQELDDLPVTIIPAPPRGSGRKWSPIADDGGDENVVRTAAAAPAAGEYTGPPRADDISPVHRTRPPRADDISPTAGARPGQTIVVPAPPRRSPPKRSSTPGTSRSSPTSDP